MMSLIIARFMALHVNFASRLLSTPRPNPFKDNQICAGGGSIQFI